MSHFTGVLAVARLDLADVMRSRWLVFCAVVYGVLATGFIFVGLRESAVVQFTGMGRVLMSFCHALVLLLPLLALTATGQVINQARDNGLFELLFSLPIARRSCFAAITAVRCLVLIIPLVILMLAMALLAAMGFGQAVPWAFLARALLLCSTLLWAFIGMGLLVSTLVRDQSRALIWLLSIWCAAVVMLDFALIGYLLQVRVPPRLVFVLAELNPVQAVRLGLLTTLEPELATYGPVGFYLAHHIGQTGVLAIAASWPFVLGSLCWWVALWRFCRGDIV
jgi:ABC-2 type transport system permease protein